MTDKSTITDEMLRAGIDAAPMLPMPELAGRSGRVSLTTEHVAAIFRAMLSASPSPPPSAGVDAVAVLRYYADTFCELGPHHECCGKLSKDECSGCLARSALTPAPTPVEAGGEADGWIDETDVAVLARIKGQAGACRITAIKAHGGPGYVPFYLAKPASEPANGAVREALEKAYAKAAEWPEKRMSEDAVMALGEGFMDLLALRNLVPSAIAALSAPASSSPAKPAPAVESELLNALSAEKPFLFDPGTGFAHADDGGAPEHCVRWAPVESPVPVVAWRYRVKRWHDGKPGPWTISEHPDTPALWNSAAGYEVEALAPAEQAGTVAQEGER